MNIFGIGTDIVNINRFKKSSILSNNKHKNKIFSKREIKYCEKRKNSASSYAKRFAAKEAVAKALGTGLINGLNLKNIEIINNKLGKPSIKVTNFIDSYIKNLIGKKKYYIHLSLTDDNPWAQAMVIISYR